MTHDVTMKNTKKELLEIIGKLHNELSEKEKSLLDPEKVKAETKTKEILKKAEEVTSSDLTAQINKLKLEINGELAALADKIESEARKYSILQESIHLKETELEEIYGIEKQAASLAAILEANRQVKEKFEAEMALQREKHEKEIRETRAAWEEEKKFYKEALTEEKKNREKESKREEEDYAYNLQRSRAIEENNYADKLADIEKEIADKTEKIDKHVEEKTALLNEREQKISEREKTMDRLEKEVENFPKELETAIHSEIEKREKELTTLFDQEKALLSKGYEGEQKVFEAKTSALESLVKDQATQIEKLNNQQEKAYQQVQDIAAKAVTGAAERPQSITVKAVEREGQKA